MRNLFIYILKRGYYQAIKNNIFQKTPELLLKELKERLAYGISLSIFIMPIGALLLLILKLLGLVTNIPKPVAYLIALVSIPLIVNNIKKVFDSISLSEIEEENIENQKKLGNQFELVVFALIGSMFLWLLLIRMTYLNLR